MIDTIGSRFVPLKISTVNNQSRLSSSTMHTIHEAARKVFVYKETGLVRPMQLGTDRLIICLPVHVPYDCHMLFFFAG
jgi:hypothetical protein